MTVIVVIASLYQMMSKMSGEGSCLGGKYDATTSPHSADNKSSKIASETGDAAKKGQRQTLLLT
jgi:hypothetical protein